MTTVSITMTGDTGQEIAHLLADGALIEEIEVAQHDATYGPYTVPDEARDIRVRFSNDAAGPPDRNLTVHSIDYVDRELQRIAWDHPEVWSSGNWIGTCNPGSKPAPSPTIHCMGEFRFGDAITFDTPDPDPDPDPTPDPDLLTRITEAETQLERLNTQLDSMVGIGEAHLSRIESLERTRTAVEEAWVIR